MQFVKKAGTKALSSADLAALFARVPVAELPNLRAGMTSAQRALLDRLQRDDMTYGEALADDGDALEDALSEAQNIHVTSDQREGVRLCSTLDQLPAHASAVAPCAW